MTQVFLDTNVPLYAAGGDHPLKAPCSEALRLVLQYPASFVTSAEVLQEMLHRYLARRAWPAGAPVVRAFADLMEGRVADVTVADVRAAARMADAAPTTTLSSRDLLHLAVMRRLGVGYILSADRGFGQVTDVTRLDPLDLGTLQAVTAT